MNAASPGNRPVAGLSRISSRSPDMSKRIFATLTAPASASRLKQSSRIARHGLSRLLDVRGSRSATEFVAVLGHPTLINAQRVASAPALVREAGQPSTVGCAPLGHEPGLTGAIVATALRPSWPLPSGECSGPGAQLTGER